MVYFDGRHAHLVLDIREVSLENFNPMCHHLIATQDFVQAKIQWIGGPVWINVYRKQLKQGGA